MKTLRNLDDLRVLIPEPAPTTALKIRDHLTPRMAEFIASSPLCLISTIDRDGFPSVSPRGDQPAVATVQGANILDLPERKGNRLIFSLQNILECPRIGVLFLQPNVSETLRVHGSADILADPALASNLRSDTQPALCVIRLAVHSAYFHCGKSLMRARMWHPQDWPEPKAVSMGREIAEGARLGEDAAAALEDGVQERYVTDL